MEKNEILQELNNMGSPLAGLPRGMPYAVPDGYFEGLANSALRAAKNSDVPAGYFDALPSAMLHAAKAADAGAKTSPAKKPVRIIGFPVRRWTAAAVLLVCLGIGGGILLRSEQTTTPLAALPAEAVTAYAEANISEVDAALLDGTLASLDAPDLTGFTPEELEAYLAETGWVE